MVNNLKSNKNTMKKSILLIALCSISLLSCKSGGEENNLSASNDKEKELLEREKTVLEKENASLKEKQNDKKEEDKDEKTSLKENNSKPADNPQVQTPVQNDGQEQYYEGSVGKLPAHFTLTWGTDNKISGVYSQANNSSFSRDGVEVYKLTGSNPSNGQLILNEFTDDKQTATIKLSKSIQGQTVSWNGTMYNTDGKTFPVSIRRTVK